MGHEGFTKDHKGLLGYRFKYYYSVFGLGVAFFFFFSATGVGFSSDAFYYSGAAADSGSSLIKRLRL